jgi:hypothetical protein
MWTLCTSPKTNNISTLFVLGEVHNVHRNKSFYQLFTTEALSLFWEKYTMSTGTKLIKTVVHVDIVYFSQNKESASVVNN